MQPIPGCRIRVWKKEWQQTVGSQTSLTTGTRRIANRNEQRSGERENKEKKEEGGTKYRKEEKRVEKCQRRGKGIRERDEEIEKGEAERLMDDSNSQPWLIG